MTRLTDRRAQDGGLVETIIQWTNLEVELIALTAISWFRHGSDVSTGVP